MNTSTETFITIPLSALRCIVRYPKEKKAIYEIDTKDLKDIDLRTLDEVITAAESDYEKGNFKTFKSAEELIKDLNR